MDYEILKQFIRMKLKFILLAKVFFLSLLILFLSNCHNLFDEDDDPEPTTEYLVSYEPVKSYLPVFVEQLFSQLVQQFPEMAAIQERVKHGIMIYKIDYNTTFQGENKMASGLVCIPMGEGSFPVISYQNGTNTLHSNAPSVNPNRDLYQMLEFITSTGFVISIPDYLGFGASDNMFHPYMHKESTVQSVIDMLRAVEELVDIYMEADLNNELYLTGYSQGGWATMQVQKTIEQQFSGEFNLKASACCAGPYDLNFINEYITNLTTYPMPYFMGYMLNSYINLNAITTPADSVFNEPYAGRIMELYDGSRTGEQINAELTEVVADLFTSNYLENFNTDSNYTSLLTALEENSIQAWATSTPTRIIHGTADDFVPPQVSANIYEDFQALGVSNRVEYIEMEGLDHGDGIIPAGLLAINWFLELTE
jgi:pimeloyl-ACP methyl ester carboxylesterase